MFFRNNRFQLGIDIDIQEYLEDYEVVSISIGDDNCYYILAVDNIPQRIDGMFPQIQTTSSHNYKVIMYQWDNVSIINICNQNWSYHFVQPIGDNKILLACGRSEFHSKDNYDLNAKIFDMNGNHIKEFLLGDGIQDLKVTKNNIIWTSYFDEGIFGNYGWSNPIGSYGLRAWNQEGESVYLYNNSGDNFIADCYALNVVNDNEVWFYFYMDFLLGKIADNKIEYFDPKLSGADAFLIYDKYVLFRGGYDNRDEYRLLEFINGNKLKEVRRINFTDENKDILKSDNIDYRGSRMLFRVGTKIYSIDLKDIIHKL